MCFVFEQRIYDYRASIGAEWMCILTVSADYVIRHRVIQACIKLLSNNYTELGALQ